jgi:hypothetical protein
MGNQPALREPMSAAGPEGPTRRALAGEAKGVADDVQKCGVRKTLPDAVSSHSGTGDGRIRIIAVTGPSTGQNSEFHVEFQRAGAGLHETWPYLHVLNDRELYPYLAEWQEQQLATQPIVGGRHTRG